jgi:Fe-S cluster biogenesis protein NfuA
MPVDDTPPTVDVNACGERIERLLAELESADPAVARYGEQLVRTLVELYGAGLARVTDLLTQAGDPGRDLLRRLADDPLVSALLVIHDLHPVDTETRVRQAVAEVRPFLGRHSGDVELLEVADGVVRLRLTGNCHGCPSSELTVRHAIEKAVLTAAPEVGEVLVEGVVAEPEPPDGPLLQIQPRPPHPYATVECPAVDEPVGEVRA